MYTPSVSFVVEGIAPPDLASYPAGVRRRYWEQVLHFALQLKDDELSQGLDRFGMPLAPLAPSTIRHRRSAMGKAKPHAPPLQPALSLSRTRSLLTGRVEANRVRLFWRKDPFGRTTWGRILEYHAKGSKRLPVRDVLGLAPSRVEMVKRRSWAWWENTKARGEVLSSKATMAAKRPPSEKSRFLALLETAEPPPRPPRRPMPPTPPPKQGFLKSVWKKLKGWFAA